MRCNCYLILPSVHEGMRHFAFPSQKWKYLFFKRPHEINVAITRSLISRGKGYVEPNFFANDDSVRGIDLQ